MDVLKAAQLQKASGEQVSGAAALSGVKVVGVYFSAHWCPPCRQFTPVLRDFYDELKELGCEIEVVFVSSDRTPADMKSYMDEAHGDWLAVSHGSAVGKQLSSQFDVSGIPMLVFLRADGTVADDDGRGVVVSQGPTKAVFNKLAGN